MIFSDVKAVRIGRRVKVTYKLDGESIRLFRIHPVGARVFVWHVPVGYLDKNWFNNLGEEHLDAHLYGEATEKTLRESGAQVIEVFPVDTPAAPEVRS